MARKAGQACPRTATSNPATPASTGGRVAATAPLPGTPKSSSARANSVRWTILVAADSANAAAKSIRATTATVAPTSTGYDRTPDADGGVQGGQSPPRG